MEIDETTRRVIRMLEHLGGAKPWGWRTQVAKQLQLAPQDVTMILNGRRHVGVGRAVKLAAKAGVDARYFTDKIPNEAYLSTDTAREEVLTVRFRRLIDELGRRLERKRGWKARVAEQLGVYPPEIPKILGGTRRIGWSVAAKACQRIGLDQRFFTDDENVYGRWLDGIGRGADPMVEREARVMSDLLLLDDATRERVLAWARSRW